MSEKLMNISKELISFIEEAGLTNEEKVEVLLDLFSNIINQDMALKIFKLQSEKNKNSDDLIFKEIIYGVPLNILCGAVYEEE